MCSNKNLRTRDDAIIRLGQVASKVGHPSQKVEKQPRFCRSKTGCVSLVRAAGGTQPVGPKVQRAFWAGRREAVGQHVFTMVLRHSPSLGFSPFIINFGAIFYQFSSHSVDSLTRPFSMTDQANQLHSGLVPNEHLGRLPTKYVPNSNLLLNVVRELLGSDFRIEVRSFFPNYIYNRTQHQLFRCAITSTISDRRKRSTWYVPPLCCRAATKPF